MDEGHPKEGLDTTSSVTSSEQIVANFSLHTRLYDSHEKLVSYDYPILPSMY